MGKEARREGGGEETHQLGEGREGNRGTGEGRREGGGERGGGQGR